MFFFLLGCSCCIFHGKKQLLLVCPWKLKKKHLLQFYWIQKETYPTPHFVGSGQQGFEKKKTCIWNGKDASSQKDQQMFSWKTRCQLCCAKLLHWLMTSHCSATPVWNSGWTNFIKFLGLASSWTKEEKYPGLYKLCWNYAVTLSVNQFGTQPKVGNCLKKNILKCSPKSLKYMFLKRKGGFPNHLWPRPLQALRNSNWTCHLFTIGHYQSPGCPDWPKVDEPHLRTFPGFWGVGMVTVTVCWSDFLVGGFNHFEGDTSQIGSFPEVGLKINKTCRKTPPSLGCPTNVDIMANKTNIFWGGVGVFWTCFRNDIQWSHSKYLEKDSRCSYDFTRCCYVPKWGKPSLKVGMELKVHKSQDFDKSFNTVTNGDQLMVYTNNATITKLTNLRRRATHLLGGSCQSLKFTRLKGTNLLLRDSEQALPCDWSFNSPSKTKKHDTAPGI